MPEERQRILVVDDEVGIRDMLQAVLIDLGYDCDAASGVAVAKSMLGRQQYDLVLLDVMMPGVSGVDLFKYVRREYPSIALVFLTAGADINLPSETWSTGLYGHVLKPVGIDELAQVLAGALDRRRTLMRNAQAREP